jgi:hypothetical protein
MVLIKQQLNHHFPPAFIIAKLSANVVADERPNQAIMGTSEISA